MYVDKLLYCRLRAHALYTRGFFCKIQYIIAITILLVNCENTCSLPIKFYMYVRYCLKYSTTLDNIDKMERVLIHRVRANSELGPHKEFVCTYKINSILVFF